MVPPPFVSMTLAALGAAVLVRHIVKEWQKGKADLDRAKKATVEEVNREAIPKLRRDPTTGIFRP